MNDPDRASPPLRPWVTRSRQSVPFVLLLVGAVVLSVFFPDVSALWGAIAVVWASIVLLMRRDPPPAGSVWARWVVPFAPFGLLVFVVVGLSALAFELSPALMAVIFVVALILSLARWKLSGPRWAVVVVVMVGAIAVPVLALLGFDALWAAIVRWVPPAWLSFPFGAALIIAATLLYLRPWWVRDPAKHPRAATLVVVVVLVVAQPVAALVIAANDDKGAPLGKGPVAVSQLDMIVLRDSSDRTNLDRPTSPQGWEVTTWVGQVRGQKVRWGDGGKPPRGPRRDADRVLLLAVDGAPALLDDARALPDVPQKEGEVERWLRVADAVTRRSTPTFALLQSTHQTRLDAWSRRLTPAGEEPDRKRHGGVRSLQRLAGDRTLTDLALRYAVFSPTADEDLALAAKHRPALFFDSGERYRTPLNIERLLASGKMKLCEKGQAFRTACSTVTKSADLHNDADHLSFKPKELAEITDDSTIYVNVTRSGNDHPNTVYLDYWWYFPHNPTGAGHGALCGIGFVLAGVTCFDHQSDWEGMTVVLDEDTDPPSPTAALYGQHDGTTRYSWPRLQRLWREGRDGGDIRRVEKRFGQIIDTDQRPLVFVARGTHASYPKSCHKSACQLAGVPLNEKRHDGKKAWAGNDTGGCTSICVAALPTRRARNERTPALWNAFDGPWGTTNCFLGGLCTSSKPPLAPGAQGRYHHPWCARTTVTTLNRSDHRRKRGKHEQCHPRKRAAENAKRLLALGDSYSSGQGAGNYEPDTTGHGNTCFRSFDSWPQVLARRLKMAALQAPACSGAEIPEVISNRARGEIERRTSQISRIVGDPDIITLTIGGNDAGFRKVLRACIVSPDCTKRYDKPSGDLLERRISEVAGQLPGVYRAIQGAASGARLVVTGYPRVFPRSVPRQPSPNCAAWRQISAKEADYLNDRGRSLNAEIAQAARAARVDFVDVSEAFDGRELRCAGPTYVNRLHLLSRLFPSSFHPNADGHARLAEVVAAAL